MVSKVYSAALQGLSAQIIEVEVATNKGLRAFNIVGLADTAIKEAKERVASAIKNIGLKPPQHQTKRVVVNLAPADVKKEGSLYDLPIALGFLLADKQIRFEPARKIILGELALDGKLKPIKGALSFALLAQEKGFEYLILPKENAKEAALCGLGTGAHLSPFCPRIIGANDLKEVIGFLEGRRQLQPEEIQEMPKNFLPVFEIELGWIKGQNHAKRGLEIAAAGSHNLMLQGPPGAGKTLLAKAIISILPQLGPEEAIELTKIYSACGLLSAQTPFLFQRPFRAPHHTASEPALIGGGTPPRPGEITLSHRGILFLDEFPEFHRDVLESLRQPIEQGEITVQRAKSHLTFPARFTLIAAANPCPCGYYNDPERECSCTSSQIAAYRRKLSGPLMDRLDIFCWVPSLKYEELVSPEHGSLTAEIREKIEGARKIQVDRFTPLDSKHLTGFKSGKVLTNAEMTIPQIKKYCQVDSNSQNILRKYVNSGKLSARGYHRVLKVARTIADLEGRNNIGFDDVNEALSYRLREDE